MPWVDLSWVPIQTRVLETALGGQRESQPRAGHADAGTGLLLMLPGVRAALWLQRAHVWVLGGTLKRGT